MMVAPTASCSSTQRDATLEIETPCFLAIALAADRMPWNGAQPPAASMKRLYFERLQSGMDAGSGLPSHLSDRKPPHKVP